VSRRAHLPVLLLLLVGLTAYRIAVIRHLGIDAYVDEAYYWTWAQSPDWGYYSKPPVIAWLIALTTGIFGDGLLALKAPSLLLYPLTALVLYRLGAEMFDRRVGLWSALVFITLPMVATLGIFVSTDAPLLFFWSLAMLAIWRALADPGWRFWLLVAVACGAGLMSKYTMAAFIGSAFLALLALPAGRRQLLGIRPWLAVLLAFAMLAPNLWWNMQHDFPTFRHTAEITRLDGAARHWNPGEFGEFIGAQWISLGPLLGALLAIVLVRVRWWWGDARYRYLACFVLPLLALVSAQALTGRANGNWAAPIVLAGTLMCVAWAFELRHTTALKLAVAINLAVMLAAYHWPDLARLAGKELTARSDPYKRARGWNTLALELAPFLAEYPKATLAADERDLLAHVAYALHFERIASWNPSAHVMDQYDLTSDLGRLRPDEVIFISRKPLDARVLACFGSTKALGSIDVEVHRDFHREVQVYLLREFAGYC
jgi:4-amino-4-deoxy-L-arabinose transferase-like glycosyltransferase